MHFTKRAIALFSSFAPLRLCVIQKSDRLSPAIMRSPLLFFLRAFTPLREIKKA
jgi:hypothetical protein